MPRLLRVFFLLHPSLCFFSLSHMLISGIALPLQAVELATKFTPQRAGAVVTTVGQRLRSLGRHEPVRACTCACISVFVHTYGYIYIYPYVLIVHLYIYICVCVGDRLCVLVHRKVFPFFYQAVLEVSSFILVSYVLFEGCGPLSWGGHGP